MKTRRLTTVLAGAILMISLMISLTLAVNAADTRTPIVEIEATVDMPVPTYGGAVKTAYAFTVDVGSPAQTANHMSGWYVYNEELQYWERYNLGVFKEGKYYYSVQIRIDQPYGSEYTFSPDATAKVNGEYWVLESINSYATYSYAYLRSPDYVVEKIDIPLSFETTSGQNLPISYQGIAIGEISVADCAIGGREPYVFSKTSGPDWINVSESGIISGTPTVIGDNSNLVVRVTDSLGAYKEVTLTVQSTKPDPAKREAVSVFTVTSDMPSPPKIGGSIPSWYNYTFTEGDMAYMALSMGYWQKHEGTGWQRYNGSSFTEGLFRYMIQLRIDGTNGELYKLADEITVTVNGKEWSHEAIFVEPTYSCVYLVSPEYTLEYEKITDVAITGMPKFTVGDTPNSSVDAITLPENAPYTVESIGWFDETADEWTDSGDVFDKDHLYIYSITLMPKDGYTFAPIGELTATVDGQAAGVYRNGTRIQLTVAAGNPISYAVTFDGGEGTGSMESLTVGGSYVLPACGFTAPEGKVFSHWSVTSVGPKAPGDTVIMTEDITVTAEWKTCSVSFEANGGVGAMLSVPVVGEYELPGCNLTPSKGYYFIAWAIGSPEGEQKKPGETINVTEDVRVFAVWAKCTVIDTVELTGVTIPVAGANATYDGITVGTEGVSINVIEWCDNSYGTVVSPWITFKAGREYYLSIKFTVAEGYEFAPHPYGPSPYAITVNSNLPYTRTYIHTNGFVRLYYTVPELPVVSFNSNGGNGEMAEVPEVYGEYTLPACGFTPADGYYFKGWAVDSPEGELKKAGESITVTADTCIYAVWGEVTIINTVDLSGVIIPVEGAYPDVSTATVNTEGIAGIETIQWCNSSSNTVVSQWVTFASNKEYHLNLKFTLEEGYELAPHPYGPAPYLITITSNLPYSRLYITSNGYVQLYYTVPNPSTVSFDANGGSGAMADVTEVFGDYTLPQCGFTAPTGYEFYYWNVNGQAKSAGVVIKVTEDINIKAVWREKSYTITFDTAGGTPVAAITQKYETAITSPADPTKVGYTFAGWDKTIPETMPAEDVTITAKWTANKYTITFNTDGGKAIDPITIDYGARITVPADPTKTGYTFAGWDKAIPETMPAENITVTAKWEQIVIPPVTSDNDQGTSEPDPGTTAPVPGTSEPDLGTTAPVPGTSKPDQNTTAPIPGTSEPIPGTSEPDTDTDTEPGTTPGTDDPNAGNTDDHSDDKDGLGAGAIVGIVICSVVVVGIGGFALFRFVIKKKELR